MLNGWYEDGFGTLKHYLNNKLHNNIYPAAIWDDGTKLWRQNDKPHRIDGPAIEHYDGRKYW